MYKTVLITGGSGFIGKNLVKKLSEDVIINKIVIVDNLIVSDKIEITNTRFEFLKLDITDSNFIEYIKNNYEKVDEIYHLASIASPKYYKKYPIETLDVGYIGTKNVLELTKYFTEKGGCKIIYTSTSEVYGDPLIHPQSETYFGNVNCYGERSCYDVSKRIGESLIYSYRKIYKLDCRIVRIFNTYGEFMRLGDGRIITEIIRCLKTGDTLKIYGNGNQTRSLCYIDDLINMLINIMNCEKELETPINIGNDNEITINDLVNILSECWYKLNIYRKLKINKNYKNEDDPKKRKPDLSKYKSIFGEIKYTELQVGLQKTCEYFMNI